MTSKPRHLCNNSYFLCISTVCMLLLELLFQGSFKTDFSPQSQMSALYDCGGLQTWMI